MKRRDEVASVLAGDVEFNHVRQPVIIAGPCVIESYEHAVDMAHTLRQIVEEHGFRFIFKSSYDKANRSSIRAFRGPGIREGLAILGAIRDAVRVPILTDIHSVDQIAPAAEIVDMIQIPAFLCRQTDLYREAGKYPVAVNVKKGQFMSPASMRNVVEKARESGIRNLVLTERGVSFGYERLVVDFTGLVDMKELAVPVVFDGTHSVQLPGAGGDCTMGNRRYVRDLCRAAAAIGVHGFFLEVHRHPETAPCDGPNMITPETLRDILSDIVRINGSLKEKSDDGS
ncbi:3-deoxy-8-phosphooctulonate synthase [bacterium]|nr:3-deoxy-8-phosphooctulonate synthase [candidate division CSSED10-310 bacterium]